MEKVVAVLLAADRDEDWCQRQRGPVADAILELGVPGLTVNVSDGAVRHSLMTLTTLDPPAAAVVSMWTQQCYGDQIAAALELLSAECDQLAAYLVTESIPLRRCTRNRATHDGIRKHRAAAPTSRPGSGDLARALAARPYAGGDRNPVHLRLHPERRGAAVDARCARTGRHRRRAVSGRGDHRSQGVLRRRRRCRSAAAAGPNGGQHIGFRRQREH